MHLGPRSQTAECAGTRKDLPRLFPAVKKRGAWHLAMGVFRRNSHLALHFRRRRKREAHRRAAQQQQRAELASDLSAWKALGDQRRSLAAAAEQRGQSWAERAEAEGLPIDEVGSRANRRCAQFIAARGLKRGVSPWRRDVGVGPVQTWVEYCREAAVPNDATLRRIVSDSLSFPLTAAFAARLVGVTASAQAGRLSLLVLGAEVGSELGGLSKWTELLGAHGLGARELHVCFVGPRVPSSLDGTTQTLSSADGVASFAFLRGAWHEPDVQARVPPAHALPQMALAFNSGLAEHAAGWIPTLRDVLHKRRVPLACTSYHSPEAELDARTLVVSHSHACMQAIYVPLLPMAVPCMDACRPPVPMLYPWLCMH